MVSLLLMLLLGEAAVAVVDGEGAFTVDPANCGLNGFDIVIEVLQLKFKIFLLPLVCLDLICIF